MTVETRIQLTRDADQVIYFSFFNATTGAAMTGTTGLAAYRTLWSGSEESAEGLLAEIGNGRYKFTVDENGNDVAVRWVSFRFVLTGAETVYFKCDCGYPTTKAQVQADIDAAPSGAIVELAPDATIVLPYENTDEDLRGALLINKPLTLEGNNATLEVQCRRGLYVRSDIDRTKVLKWSSSNYLGIGNQSGVTFTKSTRQLTKAGIFSGYTYSEGDKINLWCETGDAITEKAYVIESKTNSDTIVLAAWPTNTGKFVDCDNVLIFDLEGTDPLKGDIALAPGATLTGVSDYDPVLIRFGEGQGDPAVPQWTRTVRVVSVNQKQQIWLDSSGTGRSGTFTLTFNGQSTSSIAHNAAPATIQTALEALSNIEVGDVEVHWFPGYHATYADKKWLVEFKGNFAQESQSLLVLGAGSLVDYDGANTGIVERFAPLTIDRPVELDISSDWAGGYLTAHEVLPFSRWARNVIVRNLNISNNVNPNDTGDLDALDGALWVRAAQNVIFDNVTHVSGLFTCQRHGAENVAYRNVWGHGKEHRVDRTHMGRAFGCYESANIIADNVVNTTDYYDANMLFWEEGTCNWAGRNVQLHSTATTGIGPWCEIGSAAGGNYTNSEVRPVRVDGIIINAAYTDSRLLVGGTWTQNTPTGAWGHLSHIVSRNENFRGAKSDCRDVAVYDSNTNRSYRLYDQGRCHPFVRYIPLTNNMSLEDFTFAYGLAVGEFGIYCSNTTGVSYVAVFSGTVTSEPGRSAYNITSKLISDGWYTPNGWWSELGCEIMPKDPSPSGRSQLGWYVLDDDIEKKVRISTSTVTPGAYILVAGMTWNTKEMRIGTQESEVAQGMTETQWQQLRYRLAIDGTTTEPTTEMMGEYLLPRTMWRLTDGAMACGEAVNLTPPNHNTTTVFHANITRNKAPTDDAYNYNVITFHDGNCKGESRKIDDYDAADGSGYSLITVSPALTHAPENSDHFVILGYAE